jgi:hypothetical protein
LPCLTLEFLGSVNRTMSNFFPRRC